MRLIYIAGPFRGRNSWEVEVNIRHAETLALEVWRAGLVAICPHANTRFFDGTLPDTVFLQGDLEIIRRCDALLTTTNWQRSKGTVAEVEFAIELGLPVYHELPALIAHFL